MQINVKTDAKRVELRLSDFRRNLRVLQPLWTTIRQRFIVARIREIFDTDGFGTWPPTQRSNPILRDTRALYRSYTSEGGNNINEVTPEEFIWGSDLDYASIHEEGQGRIPPRPVIALLLDNESDNEVELIADNWVSKLVRRFFF